MENAQHRETMSGQISPFDAETVIEVTTPAAAAVKAFNSTLNDTVQACQKECAGFWQVRMHENLVLASRLMTCRTLPEVQQAYADYWRHTAEQYAREYNQMYHILHDARHDDTPASPAAVARH